MSAKGNPAEGQNTKKTRILAALTYEQQKRDLRHMFKQSIFLQVAYDQLFTRYSLIQGDPRKIYKYLLFNILQKQLIQMIRGDPHILDQNNCTWLVRVLQNLFSLVINAPQQGFPEFLTNVSVQ
jgi:hypothetical protein